MTLKSIFSALLALSLVSAAHAQANTTQVKRQAELRQSPSDTAASVATLPAQAPITRLPERQGPWLRVKTEAGQTGWIHMFDVGSAAAATPSAGTAASSALRGLSQFFGGGSAKPSTTTATSTVGIRGLGSEDIANAQPNLAALRNAEALRTDAAQAQRFAADAQLAVRAVAPLPSPEPPPATESNSPAKKTGDR
jgi:Bacterial SH3 domain